MFEKIILIFGITILMSACQNKDPKLVVTTTIDSEFQNSLDGWMPGLAGYTALSDSATMDWQVRPSRLRPPLDSTRYALKMQSTNDDSNLFMFISKQLKGLEPSSSYNVKFNIKVSTNVFPDSLDLLGKPGQNIYLKVGATAVMPTLSLVKGVVTLNVDKGIVSASGKDLISLGAINNHEIRKIFTLFQYKNEESFTVRSNSNGELWLYIGSDSAYPGKTSYYIDKATIKLSRRID